MIWQIFAAFYTGSDNDFYYISCNMDADSLQYIIDEARSRSEHIYDVEVTSSDKILTLSTCTRPVSYTHLDVYKRQAAPFLALQLDEPDGLQNLNHLLCQPSGGLARLHDVLYGKQFRQARRQ